MPELPEVETMRRGILPHVQGRGVARVDVRRPNLRFPLPEGLSANLEGHSVVTIKRRGKYLCWHFSNNTALLMHFGMSGRLYQVSQKKRGVPTSCDDPHGHVHFIMSDNRTTIFSDPRRFGFIVQSTVQEWLNHRLLRFMGPEPLSSSFRAQSLHDSLCKRKSPIKTALLNQKIVAGLGNIYVSEALFEAGIAPHLDAGALACGLKANARLGRLVAAIKLVLNTALKAGGSTLRDYRQVDGKTGYFQHSFSVYNRQDQPCLRKGCHGFIKKITQQGRASYYCPLCQG